jgi:hypothetical protein
MGHLREGGQSYEPDEDGPADGVEERHGNNVSHDKHNNFLNWT